LKVGEWSADELYMLKELYESGCDITEMRYKLKRAVGSICGRLVKDYNIVRSDIKGYNEYIKTDAYAASVIANNDRKNSLPKPKNITKSSISKFDHDTIMLLIKRIDALELKIEELEKFKDKMCNDIKT
jgi:hypothetical protein